MHQHFPHILISVGGTCKRHGYQVTRRPLGPSQRLAATLPSSSLGEQETNSLVLSLLRENAAAFLRKTITEPGVDGPRATSRLQILEDSGSQAWSLDVVLALWAEGLCATIMPSESGAEGRHLL